VEIPNRIEPPTANQPIEEKFNLFDAVGYKPIPKAVEVHNRRSQIMLILAGMRSAKSASCVPEGLNVFCQPNTNIWVVGLDYQKTDRFIFGIGADQKGVNTYVKESMPWLVDPRKHVHRKDHILENKIGSTIKGKSVKYPDSFIAEKVNLLILEDAASYPETFYNTFVRPRIVDSGGRIFINSVPPFKKNWITRLAKQADGKNISFFHWGMADNPYNSAVEVAKLRREIPEYISIAIVDGKMPTEESSIFGDVQKDNIRNGDILPYIEGHVYQAGVDIGKINDRTWLIISDLTDGTLVYYDRFPPKMFKTELVEQRILKGLKQYGYPNTRVDVTSLGEKYIDVVNKYPFLIPFQIPNNPTRNGIIEELAVAFQRQYTIPSNYFMMLELDNLDIQLYGNYYKYVTLKNHHDDFIIAAGLSLYNWAQRIYGNQGLRVPMAVGGGTIDEDDKLPIVGDNPLTHDKFDDDEYLL